MTRLTFRPSATPDEILKRTLVVTEAIAKGPGTTAPRPPGASPSSHHATAASTARTSPDTTDMAFVFRRTHQSSVLDIAVPRRTRKPNPIDTGQTATMPNQTMSPAVAGTAITQLAANFESQRSISSPPPTDTLAGTTRPLVGRRDEAPVGATKLSTTGTPV